MAETVNKKERILSSLFWKLAERLGSHGIQFIVTIILARLLSPSDYGVISIITIFTSLANVFVQSGLNSALIQKKNVDEEDFSSVFFLSLFIAFILYIILFFTSPLIAKFYDMPSLIAPLRVISIILFFGAINSIQNAKVSRSLRFKKFFLSSLIAIISSGVVGIFMAYSGYGIWALVGQQITSYVATTIVLWFTVKWRPKMYFSFNKVKSLFKYGKNILISSLLETFYNDLYTLVIGKKYSDDMLGYYSKGKLFPNFIVQNINGAISSVMFPALSLEQDKKDKIKKMVRRSITTCCLIIFPMMLGLFVVSDSLIILLLTEKWKDSIIFVQIMCLSLMWHPIHTANLQAIKALGKSDLYLKLEVAKKLVGIIALIVTLPFGIVAIAASQIFSSLISLIINVSPNKKLLNYGLKEQLKDIFPVLIISIISMIPVYFIKFLSLSNLLTLIIQVIIGAVVYIILIKIFEIESFEYLLNTSKEFVKKKVKK